MKTHSYALVLAILCGSASCAPASGSAKTSSHLPKWITVKTPEYTLQLPQGWSIGPQTPFGQRTLAPKSAQKPVGTFMTAMTAPQPVASSWSQLYHTALYFITQQDPSLKATPYHLWRSPQGMSACSWEMKNTKGQIRGLYTVLRSSSMQLLALSVHIPNTTTEKTLSICFQHLVDTAQLHAAPSKSVRPTK